MQLQETVNLLKSQLDKSVTQGSELAAENEKVMAQNKEQKERLETAEADLAKKTKYIESSKQRQLALIEEKQEALDQAEALQKELNSNKGERAQVNAENDNQLSELMERIRGKDLVIDQNATELRQLRQKIQSQETSIAFFKKKVDEVQTLVEQEKAEKQEYKSMCATYRKSIVTSMQATVEEAESNPFGAPADQTPDEQPKSARGEPPNNFEQLKQKVKTLQEADAPQEDQPEVNEEKVDERDEQLKSLQAELERLAEDYSNLNVMKNKLEAQNNDFGAKSEEQEGKISKLEENAVKMKATIKELEKRRDQAIKEIKSLKHQIRKEQKAQEELKKEQDSVEKREKVVE